jgi:opacity protein-like surface antigen
MQVPAVLPKIFVLAMCFLLVIRVSAQDDRWFNLGGGAGFSLPTSDTSASLNTGWNVGVRGGLNVTPHFLADLDFTYNQWDLTRSALARFAEPNGHADVWSLTFTPVVRFAPHSPVDAYILGGYGLYHRGLTITRPANATAIFCDFFFGFCFPTVVTVDQVVASFSTYKGGFNAGGGLEFRLGSTGLKAFGEARYHEMFTSRGPNLTFVPVTFGLRW